MLGIKQTIMKIFSEHYDNDDSDHENDYEHDFYNDNYDHFQ